MTTVQKLQNRCRENEGYQGFTRIDGFGEPCAKVTKALRGERRSLRHEVMQGQNVFISLEVSQKLKPSKNLSNFIGIKGVW